jgi:citrate synthase
MELARSASLEDVAALLWECSARRIAEAPAVPLAPAQWAAWLKLWGDSTPLDRALVLLPAAAAQMPRVWALGRDAQLDTACAVMRLLGAAMISAAPSNEPLHRQLASAWRVRNRERAGLLRAALVACADHELNASTFTVRCITSTGTHLFGAVAGGLAALSGPRHGGETVRIAALLDEASRAPDLDRYLANRLARHEHRAQGPVLSGFGHPLYPDGDPRARLCWRCWPIARRRARRSATCCDSRARCATRPARSRPSISRSPRSSASSRCRPAPRSRCLRWAGWSAGSRMRWNRRATAA